MPWKAKRMVTRQVKTITTIIFCKRKPIHFKKKKEEVYDYYEDYLTRYYGKSYRDEKLDINPKQFKDYFCTLRIPPKRVGFGPAFRPALNPQGG